MSKTNIADLIINYKSKTALIIFYLLALALSYFLLVAPGQSYTSIHFCDAMSLLDASYRVSLGQVPSKDFYSAIGPLNFYLSSIGLSLGLNPGVTFALGGVLAFILILTPGLLMMYTRFSTISILFVSVYYWLLIVVPIDTGDSFNHLTWAMFYSRYSWAALSFVFLFYVEPTKKTNKGKWLDGTLLAILVLFTLYCKITYGVIALAFVFANMFVSKYNRSISLISLVIIIISIILIGLTIDLNDAYLKSILSSVNSRGIHRGGFWGVFSTLVKHANILVAGFIAMIYLAIFGKNRIFDTLFILGCMITGIVITDQNSGPENVLPVMFAVFMCSSELIRRININSINANSTTTSEHSLAVLILLAVFIAGPIANRVVALHDYYTKSTTMQPIAGTPEKLSTFLVSSRHRHSLLADYLEQKELSPELFGDIRLSLEDTLSTYEYYLSIIDGHDLLKPYVNNKSNIFVLDISNPFMFTLGLSPRKPGHPFKYGVPNKEAKVMFNGATLVMEPKMLYEYHRAPWFKKAYGDFLNNNYVKLASSKYWHLWSRN